MNDQLPAPDLLGTIVGWVLLEPYSLIQNLVALFAAMR